MKSALPAFRSLLRLGAALLLAGCASKPIAPVVKVTPAPVAPAPRPPQAPAAPSSVSATTVAWHYAALPGAEVMSSAPDASTAKALHDYLLFRRAVDLALPGLPAKPNAPAAALIFCWRQAEYLEINPRAGPRSRSFSRPMAPIPVLGINYDVSGADASVDDAIARILQAFHTQITLARVGGHVPPWLSLGLGRILRGMMPTEDALEYPALRSDPTLATRRSGAEADLHTALGNGTFLTLDQLFAAPAAARPTSASVTLSPADNPRSVSFYLEPSGALPDESYEFVHLCLFGAQGKYREPFMKFAALVSDRHPVDAAAFQALFGVSYENLLLELWRYTVPANQNAINLRSLTRGATPALSEVSLRPAADAEVARLKAVIAFP